MQCRKSIRNNSGFTLVEMLVAFSCVAVSCSLLMPLVSTLQRLQRPVYYTADRLAIYQLRFLLAQSSELSLQEQTLSFTYQKKKQTLEYDRRRLVRRSGYEIFLQDVDALQFQKRRECYYVTWVRKDKREEALLTCE